MYHIDGGVQLVGVACYRVLQRLVPHPATGKRTEMEIASPHHAGRGALDANVEDMQVPENSLIICSNREGRNFSFFLIAKNRRQYKS
jgi:hypothetical protein